MENMEENYERLQYDMVQNRIIDDLAQLEIMWKKEKKLSETVVDMFSNTDNSYYYAYQLMKQATFSKVSTLPYAVMVAFKKWLQYYSPTHHLDSELKRKVLTLALNQKNGALISLCCELYQMQNDSDGLIDIIEKCINEKKFNQACYVIVALNLQRAFPVQKVVLPLFFEDKMSLVKNYLKNCPEMQIECAKIIDSVCSDSKAILDLLRSLNVIDSKTAKKDSRWIQKALSKFINTYEISPDECPTLNRVRSFGAMNYLIYKRFTEKSVSNDSWEEMITATVKNDRCLQKELIMKLICINETEMALKVAESFHITQDELPDVLKQAKENFLSESNSKSGETENIDPERWDDDINCPDEQNSFLCFPSDSIPIHFIDEPEEFMECIHMLSKNYKMVGIDAEWRPSFGLVKEKLSLLQVAVSDAVYLFDILTMSPYLSLKQWDRLFQNIFCNPELLKLGYGIKADLQMLFKNYKAAASKATNYAGVLDLGVFCNEIKGEYPFLTIDIEDETLSDTNVQSKGLSRLCKTLLGKCLNKKDQFSDWQRRPLREAQVTYAALDAYCLLLIYEKLSVLLKEFDVNIDELIAQHFKPKQRVIKKVAKTSNVPQMKSPDSHGAAILINKFKVVVDNMLQGLGRQLRMLGADVVILENEQDHTDTIKIAQAEQRYILSSGSPYNKIKGYLPENMCLFVPLTFDAHQQAMYVLKCFNIKCREEDIFSRCTICNCDHYMQVSSKDLKALWELQSKKKENDIPKDTSTFKTEQPFIENTDGFITEDGILHTGAPLALNSLSSVVFTRMEYFLICTQCGKIYWEGSHHVRTKQNVSSWLEESNFPLEEVSNLNVSAEISVQNNNETSNEYVLHQPGPSLPTEKTNLKTDSIKIYAVDEDDDDSDCSDLDDIVY